MFNWVEVLYTSVPINVPCLLLSYKSVAAEYAVFFPYTFSVRPLVVFEFHTTVILLTLPPDVVVTIPLLLLELRS